MANAKQTWQDNKAIGNIAENIVQFLIESTSDWKCIKFGMENHIEELKKLIKDKTDEISLKIKSMPDFIAVNSKTNQVIMLDVKYRSFIDRRESGKVLYGFGYGQIKDYLQYWPEIYLVVLHNHEPNFTVINMKEVLWHRHFYDRKENGDKIIEEWNFAGIQEDIKEIFPELTDEILKKAISMIPNR